MDLKHPYLTRHLIAYIGNKRRLLPLINEALDLVSPSGKELIRFFDGFCGSGSVSRLARIKGMQVWANDWEDYSRVLNSAALLETTDSLSELFGGMGELEREIERLNNLPAPSENQQYISKYYAPSHNDPDLADFKTERLFYTRENALIIDAVRNELERLFPAPEPGSKEERKKNFLLSMLLYKAATHNNTSGLFKAYHKGFGGHNKDALSRITRRITLEIPPLPEGSLKSSTVSQSDVNKLVHSGQLPHFDIAYLDPPYNQHQYGSNYHMLNTIVRWDRIPAPLDLNDKGELREKAAIRKDWVKTRSPYCYKDKATAEFQDLINGLSADQILLSYSSDGIIPFNSLIEICRKKGRLSILTNEYTKYRGGRQSNSRQQTNIEFIIRIECGHEGSDEDLDAIHLAMLRKNVLMLFKRHYRRAALYSIGKLQIQDQSDKIQTLIVPLPGRDFSLQTAEGFSLKLLDSLTQLNEKQLLVLKSRLEEASCQSKTEELDELICQITRNPKSTLARKIPPTLKKLAHRKYRSEYEHYLLRTQKAIQHIPGGEKLVQRLLEVDLIAQKRFS